MKAKELATEVGLDDFKGSNGWLEAFRKRHNIEWKVMCGEAADIDCQAFETWKQRLPAILQGYALMDLFNADELGLFFKQLPDRSMAIKGTSCVGLKFIFLIILCNSKTKVKSFHF